MPADTQAPSVDLKIGEETYQLCFTFAALQEAKRILRREGIKVNLLVALDSLEVDYDTLPALFYGALRTHHPEMDYKRALAMLDPRNAHLVFGAIFEAYAKSIMEADGEPSPVDPSAGPKD